MHFTTLWELEILGQEFNVHICHHFSLQDVNIEHINQLCGAAESTF